MSGNKLYSVEYLESVIKTDIPALSKSAKLMIKKAIEERLTVDPIGFGKPLRYSLKGHRRLRVSVYRIVYRIEPSHHRVIVTSCARQESNLWPSASEADALSI